MLNQFRKFVAHWLRFSIALLLAGCANVHFEHGQSSLDDTALVFGKILLVRDGESSTLNPTSTAMTIGKVGASTEPLMITESFGNDGRFYWRLAPGNYLLNITLSQRRGDVVSQAFVVPSTSHAYYFGDLVLRGARHFDTLGGANVKDVSVNVEDHFQVEKEELLRRNPKFALAISKLEVQDASNDKSHQAVLLKELESAPACCQDMRSFHYEKLMPGGSKVFEISQHKGAFQFPEGKSYFVAFELPPYTGPYMISLRSLVSPSGIMGRFRVFVPVGKLLNGRFEMIGKTGSDFLHPVGASIFPPRSASMDGVISMTVKNAMARYLVLHTTDPLLGISRRTTVPGMIPIAGGALPSGMPQIVGMVPWVTGRVEVTLSEMD